MSPPGALRLYLAFKYLAYLVWSDRIPRACYFPRFPSLLNLPLEFAFLPREFLVFIVIMIFHILVEFFVVHVL